MKYEQPVRGSPLTGLFITEYGTRRQRAIYTRIVR